MRAPLRQRVFFAFRQHGVLAQIDLFGGDNLGAYQGTNLIRQAAEIDEFEQGCLLNGRDGLLRVAHAGQFHQNSVAALHLHGGFSQPQRVDPS